MQLHPETLLAAGKATSYEAMTAVLAGRPADKSGPLALGSAGYDMVYTPVTPCRLADTRVAGGQITGGTTRQFDADGPDLSFQGGSANGCGVPYGVAYSIVIM